MFFMRTITPFFFRGWIAVWAWVDRGRLVDCHLGVVGGGVWPVCFQALRFPCVHSHFAPSSSSFSALACFSCLLLFSTSKYPALRLGGGLLVFYIARRIKVYSRITYTRRPDTQGQANIVGATKTRKKIERSSHFSLRCPFICVLLFSSGASFLRILL